MKALPSPSTKEYLEALDLTRKNQWMFRVVYSTVRRFEYEHCEQSIAARLLWQYLKYHRLSQNIDSFLDDAEHCDDLSLQRVVDLICFGVEPEKRLIILNLDEVNALLGGHNDSEKKFLGKVLIELAPVVIMVMHSSLSY